MLVMVPSSPRARSMILPRLSPATPPISANSSGYSMNSAAAGQNFKCPGCITIATAAATGWVNTNTKIEQTRHDFYSANCECFLCAPSQFDIWKFLSVFALKLKIKSFLLWFPVQQLSHLWKLFLKRNPITMFCELPSFIPFLLAQYVQCASKLLLLLVELMLRKIGVVNWILGQWKDCPVKWDGNASFLWAWYRNCYRFWFIWNLVKLEFVDMESFFWMFLYQGFPATSFPFEVPIAYFWLSKSAKLNVSNWWFRKIFNLRAWKPWLYHDWHLGQC